MVLVTKFKTLNNYYCCTVHDQLYSIPSYNFNNHLTKRTFAVKTTKHAI